MGSFSWVKSCLMCDPGVLQLTLSWCRGSPRLYVATWPNSEISRLDISRPFVV
jgi:hypothetical protein